jgi:hypothetical protein
VSRIAADDDRSRREDTERVAFPVMEKARDQVQSAGSVPGSLAPIRTANGHCELLKDADGRLARLPRQEKKAIFRRFSDQSVLRSSARSCAMPASGPLAEIRAAVRKMDLRARRVSPDRTELLPLRCFPLTEHFHRTLQKKSRTGAQLPSRVRGRLSHLRHRKNCSGSPVDQERRGPESWRSVAVPLSAVRHEDHQPCSSEVVRTGVQIVRRGKRPQGLEHVCAADVQHGSEKCTGQSAIDWSMGKSTGEVLLISRPNLDGRRKVRDIAQGETKRAFQKRYFRENIGKTAHVHCITTTQFQLATQ